MYTFRITCLRGVLLMMYIPIKKYEPCHEINVWIKLHILNGVNYTNSHLYISILVCFILKFEKLYESSFISIFYNNQIFSIKQS